MIIRITHVEVESDNSDDIAALVQQAIGGFRAAPAVEHEPPLALPPAKRRQRRDVEPIEIDEEPAKPQTRAAPGGGESIASRIMEALRKKAMSSGELQNALKLQPSQVHTCCHNLKQRNLIESKTDDANDGTRRWYIVKGEGHDA